MEKVDGVRGWVSRIVVDDSGRGDGRRTVDCVDGSTGMDTAEKKGSASAGVVTGYGGDGVAFAVATVAASALVAEERVQASPKRRCSKRVDSL